MNLIKTPIEGLLIFNPNVYFDDRGFFYESWNSTTFKQFGLENNFVQDNQSCSKKNVLRGLHFQNPPYAQGKLVRVMKGRALDVVVDLRKKSKYYGKSFSIELSEENKLLFWIPAGFAHGFLSLEDNTIFCYKCTNIYNRKYEENLIWNDPLLDINWGIENPIVSDKDQKGTHFCDFVSKF